MSVIGFVGYVSWACMAPGKTIAIAAIPASIFRRIGLVFMISSTVD
jgi:hypothetical protein